MKLTKRQLIGIIDDAIDAQGWQQSEAVTEETYQKAQRRAEKLRELRQAVRRGEVIYLLQS